MFFINVLSVMDQLSEIRKLAAERYLSIKTNPPSIKKQVNEQVINILNMDKIYVKNPDGYFIYVNNEIIKIEELIYELWLCQGAMGIGRNKPLSEFGKTINSGYIKTIKTDKTPEETVYKINDETFIIPFLLSPLVYHIYKNPADKKTKPRFKNKYEE